MLSPEGDYRQALKQEFESRCRSNARYSLRAFSRFLGMPSAQLSDVLNAKYGISSEKAAVLAKKLGYSTRETELFCTLVEKEHARSKVKRQAAALRLEKFRGQGVPGSYDSLANDAFAAVSGWFHFPIVELTRVDGFVSDPAWIARRLGISVIEADLAIGRLLRLGLLKRVNGKLEPSQDFYGSSPGVPSSARRASLAQFLKLALSALEAQPIEKRDFSVSVMAVDSSKIAQVREMAEEFRLKVDTLMQASSNKDKVYCLSVQFFGVEGDAHGK